MHYVYNTYETKKSRVPIPIFTLDFVLKNEFKRESPSLESTYGIATRLVSSEYV